jgi:signal transduction histidine kinase
LAKKKDHSYFLPKIGKGYFFSGTRGGNEKIQVIMPIVIVALIVDTMINNVADFVSKQIASEWGVSLFIIITITGSLGQYFLLMFVKHKTKEVRIKSVYLNITYIAVTILQYCLIANILFIIFNIVMAFHYYIVNLILATIISYTLNISLLLLFAQRLISWYRTNRSLKVVLFYGLSALMLSFSSGVAVVTDSYDLLNKQGGAKAEVTAQSEVVYPSFDPGTLRDILHNTYQYSDLISFILVWLSTLLFLHHYSQRLVRIKYWILVTLPLVYFLSSFIEFFNLYTPNTDTEQFYYYLYASLNSTAGGILFGLAFRTIARSIPFNNIQLRNYMTISAYGFILLFISNQSTLIAAPYPPFGFVTVSFMGLTAYLMFAGLYSAAMSIAHDERLRQSIRKSAIEESKLLVSIGAAQMEQKIRNIVIEKAKNHAEDMTYHTGVQSSLTDSDMEQYLSTVLKEIKVIRNVDEILKKGRDILENSTEFSSCSKFNAIRLAYNNYFSLYEKVMEKYRKGEHSGIRFVTSITDKDGISLLRKFLDIGVQIRHVKNMPPVDFSISDKEMVATIEKMETGEVGANLLITNDQPYMEHFTSIFEKLWKNGVDAVDRIQDIEEGVDTEGIEIIQNPEEIQKIIFNLLKSAEEEILIVFSSANAFHRQEYSGTTRFLKEAANKRGVRVRILTPADDLIVGTSQRLTEQQQKQEQQSLKQQRINIRFIEPYLQTKVSLLIVDRKFSLAVELRDDAAQRSYEAMGLATYSNSKPTVLSYVSIFENLWRQNELYQQVKEANEQLKVHDKMQKEFIDVAAHELRTPVQPILALSDILLAKNGNIEEHRELLEVIARSAQRLQRLTNDILDVTKIESKLLELNKERFNLNDLLYSIVKEYRNRIIQENKKDHAVTILYEPENEFFVNADRERLVQVISNLLSNAITFTKQGTISVVIEKKDEQEFIVSVKDTGEGIHPEILPKLFTKFATKSYRGTGLGLYISKSIIEAHGGKMWAKNNIDNKGATFYISLPINGRTV